MVRACVAYEVLSGSIFWDKMDGLRNKILKCLYWQFPFNLKGDLTFTEQRDFKKLSCIINFYGRIHLLEGILYSLSEQDMQSDEFEVILIEDRRGTEEGKRIAERFSSYLDIRYYALSENFGLMGYSRNLGLSRARGRYILFLDDDTVILQKDFLSTLLKEFDKTWADGVIPCGSASYYLLKGRYGFHDPYFPTSRCMAYRRDVLEELGGFVSDMIGQEDVEFIIRFIAAGKRYHSSRALQYLHPPLIMNNLNKAKAVGISFTKLKERYPFCVWLLIIMNGARFFPKLLFPFNLKWRMQGKFSLGFLLGVVYGLLGHKTGYN